MDFASHLLAHYSRDFVDKLLESLQGDPLHCLVLNPSKIKDQELLERIPSLSPHPFIPHSYFYSKKDWEAGKSLFYDLGCFSIQDASAMMVPFFLNPLPGETVLDFCAAPGGKTIFMSLNMEQKGLVVANDLSFPRAKALSQNVERMGLGNVAVISDNLAKKKGQWKEAFDKILLDAPCSGSAMFRKDEEAKRSWSMDKVLRCASIQKELLDLAASFLKPGGILAYSTCSFSYEENEGNIVSFLSSHPEMKALSLPIDSPLFRHDETIKEGIHLDPGTFPGEGQYLCLLRKKGSSLPSSPFRIKTNDKIDSFLATYGLIHRTNILRNGLYSSLSAPFDPGDSPLLRYGIRVLENKEHAIPEFALSRALPVSFSLPLTKEQARKYLNGETIPLPNAKDAFAIVSYQNKNLGWVKCVKGNAKNHYPKGLRHLYPLNEF